MGSSFGREQHEPPCLGGGAAAEGRVCASAVRGAAEGMEDRAMSPSPRMGERPQRRSRTQALGQCHAGG